MTRLSAVTANRNSYRDESGLMETIIGIVGFVVMAAGIYAARRAKEPTDIFTGTVVAIGSAVATFLALYLGHQQGSTIEQQTRQIHSQATHISTLERTGNEDSQAILSLAKTIGMQQAQIAQNRLGVNQSSRDITTLAEIQMPRDVTDEIKHALTAFASKHRKYRYVLYAQPGGEDSKYIANSVATALRAGGGRFTMRDDITLPFQVHRLALVSSPKDGDAPAALYAALKQVDHFTTWQRQNAIQVHTILIAVGDRG